jgi:hypothetical protein
MDLHIGRVRQASKKNIRFRLNVHEMEAGANQHAMGNELLKMQKYLSTYVLFNMNEPSRIQQPHTTKSMCI